jgi:hypothetical protein
MIVGPSSSGSSSPRRMLHPEDADTTTFRNVSNYLPSDTAQHRRLKSSVTLL